MISWNQIVPIGKDEKTFFVQLGARIAALRKGQSITQVQLAELLKVSQQTINAYEVGRRRMPVSSLPVIARIQRLPKTQQRMVMQMIDAVLAQQGR